MKLKYWISGIVLLTFASIVWLVFFNRGFGSTSNINSSVLQSNTKVAEPAHPCKLLTPEKLTQVFKDSTWAQTTVSLLESTSIGSQSECNWKQQNNNAFEQYYINLTVQVLSSAEESALQVSKTSSNPTLPKPIAITIEKANGFYLPIPIEQGGPALIWSQGSMLYQLQLQTLKEKVFESSQKELYQLALLI